jgi:fermentation-respiration switch protein FrsA (DUF1100 family)
VVVALWLLGSYAVAYYGTRRPHPLCAEREPALSWGKIESFRLATADGQNLGAWFIDGRADRPAVLLLHGNHGQRGDCLKQGEMLAAAGCPVLLISLRAHGDSTGKVNDFGYSARQDVIAAVGWLQQKRPSKSIIVWGASMGAAAAVFAAGDLGESVQGYILECPYQDLRTAVRNRMQLYLPPLLDVAAYAGLMLVSPLVVGDVDRMSPLAECAKIPEKVPVLLLAGGADQRARPEEADAIYQRVRSHARLEIIDGADHMGLFRTDPIRYRQVVLEFVEAVASPSRARSAAE